MQEWGGAEETANGGDRTTRKYGDGLRDLREATRSGPQFQIPGADNDGGGRRLASGGRKPGEGAEELGTAGKDLEQGRGVQEGVGDVIQRGGAIGATVRGRDVGAEPTDREGAGELHAWGRAQDHRETSAERVGWEMVLPLSGGGHERGRFTEIWKSITNRQNTVTLYISTQPILELCEQTTQRRGARLSRRWWDQKVIDWETAKERAAEKDSESES